MKETDSLRNALKPEFSGLSDRELLKHFSERRKPIYLFDASEAARIKDDGILEDARKVMDHDIFRHKLRNFINFHINHVCNFFCGRHSA